MITMYISAIEGIHRESARVTRERIGFHLHVDSENLVIHKSPEGKPFLADYPDIQFNVSHTRNFHAVVVSDVSVGVDVEVVKDFDHRIPHRFFLNVERDFVFQGDGDSNLHFAQIWTMKEAYLKWIGKGMRVPLDSINVLEKTELVTFMHDSYCISICSEDNPKTIMINDGSCIKEITQSAIPCFLGRHT